MIPFAPPLSPADKTNAKERWTAPVLERGYSIVPSILIWGQAKLGLNAEELNVLLQLISHWGFPGNDPHPSKQTIAERMGKHVRTVQHYLTRLETRGFILRVKRFRPSDAQDTNGYDLAGLVAKLNVLAPEFKKVTEQNKLRRRRVERPAG